MQQNQINQQAKQNYKERGIIPAIKYGHMAAPALTQDIDYSTFEKTPQEQGKLFTMKRKHKQELKKHYGSKANKHLNIPSKSLPETIRFTF